MDPQFGLALNIEVLEGATTPPGQEEGPQQGNNDLGDEGPAPLQFVDDGLPEEAYEGVLNVDNSNGADISICDQAIALQVGRIRALDHGNDARDVPVQIQGNTAIMAAANVLPTTDFVNMMTTEYAHAKAWPTLFIPWFGSIADGLPPAWHITHDFKGWSSIRDWHVKYREYVEYQTWHSDGRVAKHPTASLVMFNLITKNRCYEQGQYVVNTSDLDAATTVQELRDAPNDGAVKAVMDKIIDKAHIHTGSVMCTPQYWRNVFSKFEATTFWHSYIKQRELTVFTTGSLAEYHDFHLRHLLYKYKKALSGSDPEQCQRILTTDSDFAAAMNDCKHLCGHFLATKMELWFAHFLSPVYGITDYNVTYEFAKSRGAIHYHSPAFTKGEIQNQISTIMCATSIRVSDAQDVINDAITLVYLAGNHDVAMFEYNPATKNNHMGKRIRESFVKYVENVQLTAAWNEYISTIETALDECATSLEPIMEGVYGLCAMHTGCAPTDWMRPASNVAAKQSYHRSADGMLTSTDVLEKRELKRPKFLAEHDLFQRKANIINHTQTHKCQDYCARSMQYLRDYDDEEDYHLPEEQCFTDSHGVRKVRCTLKHCRFHFGQLLDFDPSGENDLTRGIDRIDKPFIKQRNGILINYYGRRNHPRVVQCPHGSAYFAANNDTQFMLHNGHGAELLHNRGREWYEKYLGNLSAAGLSGLEHWNASHCLHKYATGYACKGNQNPEDWKQTRDSITDKYCSSPTNEDKTFRSVISKHMNEIVGGMALPKDQALYCNGGGIMKQTSLTNVIKCSVSSINVSDLGASEIAQQTGKDGNDAPPKPRSASFTWQAAMTKYKKRQRTEAMERMNLFKFVTFHWKKDEECVPIFMEYPKNPMTWPLPEIYCKWTLAIFKPWRTSYQEHQHPVDGSYRSTMEQFIWEDDQCPGSIRSEILRVKRSETWQIDLEDHINQGDEVHTPTDDRENEVHEEAFQVAEQQLAANPQPEHDGDVALDEIESRIRLMDKRCANHDWSANYQDGLSTALVRYQSQYYDQSRRETIDGSNAEDGLDLYDDHIYCPEKAKTDSQTLLIMHHLLCQKALIEYNETMDKTGISRPPDRRVLVEGLPGVGKSWVTKTLRNITRQLHNCNTADMASTPTGCSAALVDGKTHYRAMFLTPGTHFLQTPTNMAETQRQKILEARIRMATIVAWFMDEHSMTGREMWAWLHHRSQELRRPLPTVIPRETDRDQEDVLESVEGDIPVTNIPRITDPAIYERPWGGIPFIYSFGDSYQLAPVGSRSFYSPVNGNKPAEAVGKLVVANFLNPPDKELEESSVFLLDEVVCQEDPQFLGFLSRLRSGGLQDHDKDFLTSRCLDTLPLEEQERFKDALHLVPMWKMGHEITFNYLNDDLDQPIAVLQAVKQSVLDQGNCFNHSSTMPTITALCIGAKVMLQQNFIVEHQLMNGSVGTVVDICYSTNNGPYDPANKDDSEYVVVEFPHSTLPVHLCGNDMPSTYVPIPVTVVRCERNCCSCKGVPLRVCKAISIHKAQGATFGENQPFSNCVSYLPYANSKTVPGLELVSLSRAQKPTDLAIGNRMSTLNRVQILKIGTSNAYKERQDFHTMIKERADATKTRIVEQVKALDPIAHKPTYDGGCAYLLGWFRGRVGPMTVLPEENVE